MEILLMIKQIVFTPLALMLRIIGTILKPILPFLQNGFIQFILLLIFIKLVLSLLFDSKTGERHMISDLNYEIKLSLLPLVVSFLLGMHFRSSIHMSICGEPDTLVTFFNFMNWPWTVQMYLIILIITGIIALYLYSTFSLRMAIRFICTVLVMIFAGNLIMSIYVLTQFLSQEIRGIFYLIGVIANMINPIIEGVFAGPFLAAGVYASLVPVESVYKYVRNKEAHEHWKKYGRGNSNMGNSAGKQGSRSEFFSVFDLPKIITGPYNNKYKQFNITRDYAEYQCIETKEIIRINNEDIDAFVAYSTDGERFIWH